MSVEVKQVDTSKHKPLIKYFKNANMFYRDDPNYVPQIIGERLGLVNKRKNAFYRHGDIAHFIAYKNGGIAGQISAITNENHNETHGDNLGFFGFFECEDDQEVADALVAKALEWTASKGKTGIRGPFHPSINDELGILIDGFDEPPNVLMRYNPPYYDKLLLNSGLKKAKDLYAYDLNMEDFRTEKLERLKDKIVERYNLRFESFYMKDKEKFLLQANSLKKIYDEAWENHWGAVKMTDDEFMGMVGGFKQIVDSRLPFLVYSEDRLAGMALVVQDINRVMIYNKKQTLLSFALKYLRKKKEIDRVRIIMLGLLPQFQKKGIDAAMYHEVARRADEAGYKRGEASWVLEDNEMMIKAATKTMNGRLYKKYRIYEIEGNKLTPEQPVENQVKIQ